MGKTTKETDSKPEETAEPVIMKHPSVDEDNGIVVYETTAPDGTAFTLRINEQLIEGTAKAGQVWFYAGASIGTNPVISLQ